MKGISKWIICFLFAAAVMFITGGTSYALDDEAGLPDNGLPVVIIEVDETEGHTINDMNGSKDHSVECSGTMRISVPEGFQYCDLDKAPESLGPVKLDYIRGRGNSTWKIEKKPYKIKLKNAADIFGLGENKHWVLLANALDPTAIKNRWVGWLGDELGFAFTPRGVPVDVVMIGKRDGEEISREYLGNYLFAEHLRIDKNRLEITELKPKHTDAKDITGGYLIQQGNQVSKSSPNRFYTNRGFCLANDTPTFDPADSDYTNEEQKQYIRERIQDMENAIYGEGVDDEEGDFFIDTKGIRYNEYMDMESAAKYWLIQELSVNGDAYITGSTYFYKKQDTFDESGQLTEQGKFYWGPLWDFDLAFATEDPDVNVKDFTIECPWIKAMLYDNDEAGFRQTVKRVWPQVREKTLAAVEDGGLIDQYCGEIEKSYAADYEIWADRIDDVYQEREDCLLLDSDMISILKQWTRNRVNWMDAHILGEPEDGYPTLDDIVRKVSYVADGRVIRRDYCRDKSYLPLRDPGQQDSGYAPEKEGYVFAGWLKEDGSSAGRGVQIMKDTTLTAQFVPEVQATHAEELRFRMDKEWCNIDEANSFDSKYTVIPSTAQEKTITWSSSDESIATVDQEGKVALHDTGVVLITGTLRSGASSSYELTITSGAQPVLEDMTIAPEEITLEVGEHAHIDATILPELARTDGMWFFPEDFIIASVDENGVVTGESVGTTRIVVEADYYDEETDHDISVKKYCTVTVVPASGSASQPIHIKQARVKPATRTGEELEPEVVYHGEILKAGVDYKWVKEKDWSPEHGFETPDFIEPGDYKITLYGKGRFTGTQQNVVFSIIRSEEDVQELIGQAQAELETAQAALANLDPNDTEAMKQLFANLFRAQNALTDAQNELTRTRDILNKEQLAELEDQIAQMEQQMEDLNDQVAELSVVDISKYTVTMKTSCPYTGKAIKPAVKVSGLNESCYTVSYSNNKKIGTATVIIKAKGDRYTGTIQKTFKITKGINTLKVKGKTATIKYSKVKKKAQTLKVAKVIKVARKGQGKLTYAKASGNKKITINKKTGKVTVKKGLKKGTYKVKVKVTAAGNANYRQATKKVTFRIKVK